MYQQGRGYKHMWGLWDEGNDITCKSECTFITNTYHTHTNNGMERTIKILHAKQKLIEGIQFYTIFFFKNQ